MSKNNKDSRSEIVLLPELITNFKNPVISIDNRGNVSYNPTNNDIENNLEFNTIINENINKTDFFKRIDYELNQINDCSKKVHTYNKYLIMINKTIKYNLESIKKEINNDLKSNSEILNSIKQSNKINEKIDINKLVNKSKIDIIDIVTSLIRKIRNSFSNLINSKNLLTKANFVLYNNLTMDYNSLKYAVIINIIAYNKNIDYNSITNYIAKTINICFDVSILNTKDNILDSTNNKYSNNHKTIKSSYRFVDNYYTFGDLLKEIISIYHLNISGNNILSDNIYFLEEDINNKVEDVSILRDLNATNCNANFQEKYNNKLYLHHTIISYLFDKFIECLNIYILDYYIYDNKNKDYLKSNLINLIISDIRNNKFSVELYNSFIVKNYVKLVISYEDSTITNHTNANKNITYNSELISNTNNNDKFKYNNTNNVKVVKNSIVTENAKKFSSTFENNNKNLKKITKLVNLKPDINLFNYIFMSNNFYKVEEKLLSKTIMYVLYSVYLAVVCFYVILNLNIYNEFNFNKLLNSKLLIKNYKEDLVYKNNKNKYLDFYNINEISDVPDFLDYVNTKFKHVQINENNEIDNVYSYNIKKRKYDFKNTGKIDDISILRYKNLFKLKNIEDDEKETRHSDFYYNNSDNMYNNLIYQTIFNEYSSKNSNINDFNVDSNLYLKDIYNYIDFNDKEKINKNKFYSIFLDNFLVVGKFRIILFSSLKNSKNIFTYNDLNGNNKNICIDDILKSYKNVFDKRQEFNTDNSQYKNFESNENNVLYKYFYLIEDFILSNSSKDKLDFNPNDYNLKYNYSSEIFKNPYYIDIPINGLELSIFLKLCKHFNFFNRYSALTIASFNLVHLEQSNLLNINFIFEQNKLQIVKSTSQNCIIDYSLLVGNYLNPNKFYKNMYFFTEHFINSLLLIYTFFTLYRIIFVDKFFLFLYILINKDIYYKNYEKFIISKNNKTKNNYKTDNQNIDMNNILILNNYNTDGYKTTTIKHTNNIISSQNLSDKNKLNKSQYSKSNLYKNRKFAISELNLSKSNILNIKKKLSKNKKTNFLGFIKRIYINFCIIKKEFVKNFELITFILLVKSFVFLFLIYFKIYLIYVIYVNKNYYKIDSIMNYSNQNNVYIQSNIICKANYNFNICSITYINLSMIYFLFFVGKKIINPLIFTIKENISKIFTCFLFLSITNIGFALVTNYVYGDVIIEFKTFLSSILNINYIVLGDYDIVEKLYSTNKLFSLVLIVLIGIFVRILSYYIYV